MKPPTDSASLVRPPTAWRERTLRGSRCLAPSFYAAHLHRLGLDFVNADLLVAMLGLTVAEGLDAADALRVAYLEERRSFVTETVFSDPPGRSCSFCAMPLLPVTR